MLGIGALAVTVGPLLLAGCGRVRAGAGAAGSPGVSASPVPARWVTCGLAGVQLVSVGGCGRVLAVAVRMPAGRDGCVRTLTAGLSEFGAGGGGGKPRAAALARRVARRGSPAP